MGGEDKKEEQTVAITYETLFDILRMEKRREDLQELQKTFFQDAVHYLKQKKEILIKKEHESGIDRVDEVKKIMIQYENIQKILKEIYERRERKILLMALNKSRTRMSTLNVDVLLPQEYEFYEQLIRLLDAYRGDVAEKVIKGFLPKEQIAAVMGSLHHTEQRAEILQPSMKARLITQEAPPQEQHTEVSTTVQVKFLQETEEFVGPELEVYGPFDANTIAVLPAKLASTFIATGIAEEVK
ncbi:MAG: hypothetical protein AABX82_03015 [Nanoarchaeota archaeon]